MSRKLRFLYRYLTTPYRLRRWFNAQTLVVFVVSLFFFAALAWTRPSGEPRNQKDLDITATLTPAPGPTRAATLSPEYLANGEQTIGVTLVGTLLVLIVVIGVLVYLPRHEDG
jgi:hypothetical protein